MRQILSAFGAVLLVAFAISLVLTLTQTNCRAGTETEKAAKPTEPKLGPNASLSGKKVFPADNPWNLDISQLPVDPNSEKYIAAIGSALSIHPDFGTTWQNAPWGIPYVIVEGVLPRAPVTFEYADESDQCMYPIPTNPPIEGGDLSDGDRHCLIIDRDNWMLYELYHLRKQGDRWTAGSGAVFDLKSNGLRPAGWTSADAAGLPVFPGLVRYDEVLEQKEISHALRFTCKKTRRAYIHPARHWASRDTNAALPPMGLRVRLKADYDITGFPPAAQVILKALKKHGMILADNGGNWFISGAPDPRWPDAEIDTLKRVKGSDFEVVQIGNIVTP